MATNSDNNLPSPESYEQLLSDALSAYAAKIGINDFNVGSAVTGFYEVVALMVARASGDIFQILRDFSVDRATGDSLQRLATENGITPITATPTNGQVTVMDSSFVKISTAIYAGTNPPNIGSITINISDASLFPASGAIYIGRGTPNIEGPIAYATPPIQVGSYWQITLSTPTTKFHNLGESVILSQGGNRAIAVGTTVLAPAVGANPDIQYSVTSSAVILDGETSVSNVLVTAVLPGSSGNVPIGAIKTFASPPFSGAVVSNPLAFTTGLDNETDDQLRVRIKAELASTGLGTSTAIKAAINGATSPNASSTIVSSQIVLQTNGSAIVYIDNGFGYEAQSQGVGLESIVDSAIGGEQFFQLSTGGSQAPVAKAYLQSSIASPFDLRQGDTLAVNVGGIVYQHVFQDSDFVNPGGATVYEITASINGNTLLGFEATTAGGGQFVVIRAKAEIDDSIKITTPTTSGRDAGLQMGFPSSLAQTLRLYKNNLPLNKDGQTADLFSQAQSLWSSTIQNGDTLILQVDDTAPITYTILDTDFIATGLYTSVASTNSLAAWQEVLQAKLTGVTVSISGQQIEIESNLRANSRAQLAIDPSSSLVTKGMFSSTVGLTAVGKSSDFTLSRNTAQFELVTPLQPGDRLSAGSTETTARIESAVITGSSITLSAEGYFWILADSLGQLITNGVSSNSVMSVSKPTANVVRYTSSVTNAFLAVQPGDYVIIWSAELNANNRLEGRVHATTSTTLDILVTASEYGSAVIENVVFIDGFVTLRSVRAPRKFNLPVGTSSLDQIAAYLQAQTDQMIFTVQQEEVLIIRSTTTDPNGYLLIVTADGNGKLLGLPVGATSTSQSSLIAFDDSNSFDGQMPLFLQNTFAADSFANPPDSNVASVTSSVSLSAFDPNVLIGFLHPYGAIKDEQPYGEYDQTADIIGAVANLAPQNLVRRARINDRFFIANPLDFGNQDNATLILDNNPTTNSFSINVYRRAITNTSQTNNPNNFNAYDVDSGVTAQFSTNFGSFDFSNFKALMKAKKVLKAQASQTAILYRAAKWGRSGEYITVAYTYPTFPNSVIGSTIEVGETTDIRINLKSGAVVPSSIDLTTEWNVTITPNTPVAGIDQVTYTWNGIGTAPALALSGGEYVNITSQTGFNAANIGVFRVSTQIGFTPTSTSFSVQRPTGVAVPETNIPTVVTGAINFYDSSATTAAEIQAYVAANLIDITATLTNDGGLSGSGVLTYSTYEDTNFTSQFVQLLDGINWIASSNLGGTPQFTFKRPLNLSTDVGYAFNNGEEVRLIPTTMEQVKNLLSVLAVTGFTTLGSISVVERGSKLEISTITLGSEGAVQVIGGYANGYQVPVLDSAVRIDNNIMSVSANNVASAGMLSDQWFRLQASNPQIKDALFSSNTDIDIVGNIPITGQSTVKLSNRFLNQRNFGRPRSYVRSQGDTFRIEKQGNLVCLSWNGSGSSPQFLKSSLNFNDSVGGSPAPIETISESDTFGGLNFTNSTNYFSQAFQIPAGPNQAVTQIAVDVFQNGGAVVPNSPVVMEIRAASASAPDHFPTGAVLATSNPINANSLPVSAGTLTTFTFPTLVSLTASNYYSFSLRATVAITTNTLRPTGQAPVLSGLRAAQTSNGGASWTSFGNGAFSHYTITAESLVVGTVNVGVVTGGDDAQYILLTGNSNFTELSIGDYLTISGLPNPANNGTFLVTGVSDDGKIAQVLNPAAENEFSSGTFTFSANSTAGDAFTVSTTTLIAGTDFAIGGTSQLTATNLANVIGTIPGVTAKAVGNVVTVTALAASASIPISYSGTPVVTVSGSFLVGDSFTSGQFSASSSVSEGDTMIIDAPFNVLNRGKYRVIRRYNDSVWFENSNVFEEEVTLPLNNIPLAFDSTTGFQVVASNNTFYLRWTGVGTEPTLGAAAMGDIINVGSAFNAANQGSFMVIRAGTKLPEITKLNFPAGSQFTAVGPGQYFLIKSAGDAQSYYVWANVNGTNTDPAPGGTGVMVAILSGDNAVQVAGKFATVLNGTTGLGATSSGASVTVTTTGSIETTHASLGTMPLTFTINLLQAGRRTFLEAINPSVVAESVLVTSGTLIDHRPQMQFSEYEATVPGDNFVVTGNVLGANNIGSFQIKQVIDRDTAIVLGSMVSETGANLTGTETSVFVQEGVAYTGYKQVKLVNSQPGSSDRNLVVFTTNAQYEKIDQQAGVQMVALNKIGFGTSLINGLDSYRFNTDLIQIANKIIYGDPTNETTYPGVGAAGAEIFVQEPLTLRIKLSIDVRLQTGVPFAATVQQIRSSVGALINSNDVGKSISLSSVISAVTAIPGVVSVVITSPLYNVTHDLIVVDPSEKTRIIDPTVDISVAQIGN